jgi:hypothetical protein
MRAGLDLLPTWVLEQKAAADRQVIAVMRTRLAAGEQVASHVPGAGLISHAATTANPVPFNPRRCSATAVHRYSEHGRMDEVH